jgi:tRNA nucleotidyltransferase (CCA-adding enzyme)
MVLQAYSGQSSVALRCGDMARLEGPLKDLDIEVHNIELDELQDVLRGFGHVEEVGKKFGVLLLLGLAIDWSLPRSDSSGRKPQVILQPQLDIKQALQRRDLTMNAMAINLTTVVCDGLEEITMQDIIDPFDGLADIAANQMRAVDDAFFVQDPLRLFRVMQFAGRFCMTPTPELDLLCRGMPLYDTYDDRPLARERIQSEVVKLLLQAPKPSLGFAWLIRIGRAEELFPFLNGNFEALLVIDRLAPHLRACSADEQVMLFLTALCYRYGEDGSRIEVRDDNALKHDDKNCCLDLESRLLDLDINSLKGFAVDSNNRTSSASLSLSCHSGGRSGIHSKINTFNKNFLINCTDSHKTIKAVDLILQILPQLKNLSDNAAGLITIKKIAAQLAMVQASFALVSKLTWCLFESTAFVVEQSLIYRLACHAGVLNRPEKPLVQGRDLLNQISPGPEFGRLLARAYQLQLEEGVRDKSTLIEQVLYERSL